MPSTPHVAVEAPLDERMAYATLVASMAAAGGAPNEAETLDVDRLCRALDLPDHAADALLAAALAPDGTAVSQAVRVLRASPLRFTVLSDVLAVAWVDDSYDEAERDAASGLALALGIGDAQLRALERTVQEHHDLHSRIQALRADTEGGKRSVGSVTADFVARLAAVGIPVGAVLIGGAPPATFQALAAAAAKGGAMIAGIPGLGTVGLAVALGIGGAEVVHHVAGLLADDEGDEEDEEDASTER
ncbi:MAG: TerB family tellurite resistance protein [Alphaproteobacteria bacterium]|nr:TerB family tellurite resistance protein [Alphaproteobacteria bacterium]